MGEKNDLISYNRAKAIDYARLEKIFLQKRDVKNTHEALLKYGIKEPYATNIILRIFGEAHNTVIDQLPHLSYLPFIIKKHLPKNPDKIKKL